MLGALRAMLAGVCEHAAPQRGGLQISPRVSSFGPAWDSRKTLSSIAVDSVAPRCSSWGQRD